MKTDKSSVIAESSKTFPENINVNLKDIVLTPLSCASIINEFMKGLLYQKNQIPYQHNWLKNVITRKRLKNKEKPSTNINFKSENHFRIISSAFDVLEEIMKGIESEFCSFTDCIKQVVILFGVTPQCPKEVFQINISSLARNHYEKHHVMDSSTCNKILRNIFLSQIWMDAFDTAVGCTNTFVFIKKHKDENAELSNDSLFVPCRPLILSANVKLFEININYDNCDVNNCCNNLSIFDEGSSKELKINTIDKMNENYLTINSEQWYQSKVLFKGFKDCFVDKISVCELW